jgi:FkbM family methyltransferase
VPSQHRHLEFEAFRGRLDSARAERQAKEDRLVKLSSAPSVTVYSYGSKGRELAPLLRARGVECFIFDNGQASRQKANADGYEVLQAIDDDRPVIVAAGQNQIEILASLGSDAFNHSEGSWAFDLPSPYGPAREVAAEASGDPEALFNVYAMLDPQSGSAFLGVLEFRAALDVYRLKGRRPVGEMWRPPVDGLNIRSFCDIGAYDGDSVRATKVNYPTLNRTFTIEPNPDLSAAINKTVDELEITNTHFVGAAWDRSSRLTARTLPSGMFVIEESAAGEIRAECLDSLLQGEQFDYIKMDVEGTERQVIDGGRASIAAARCVAVAGYHLPRDLITLPAQLFGVLGGRFATDNPNGWNLAFAHYSQVFDDSIFYAWRR